MIAVILWALYSLIACGFCYAANEGGKELCKQNDLPKPKSLEAISVLFGLFWPLVLVALIVVYVRKKAAT